MEKKELQQNAPTQRVQEPEQGKTQHPPAFQLKADGAQAPVQRQPEKKPKEKAEAPKQDLPYEFHKTKAGGVTIPKGATGSLPAIVIYGGQQAGGGGYDKMMGYTPPSYYSSHILIFTDHEYKYAGVKKEAEAYLKTQNVSADYRALLGFSQGGTSMVSALGAEAWAVIGLIDPLPSGNYSGSGKVYMVWDFWDSKKYKYSYNTDYEAARDKYNAKKKKDWKKEDDQRKKDEKAFGEKLHQTPMPEKVTDPMLVDPNNKDPRFAIHKKIKAGEIPGESEHRPDLKHTSMPGAWFERFGPNI